MAQQQTEIKDKEIIKIDLSARDDTIYSNDQIIHKKELDKVEKLIEERLKNFQNTEHTKPIHESILIEGPRGSGKTSFMNSLYKHISDNKNDYSKLELLDVLDPTLMEQKSHFFITILSLICDKVESRFYNLNDNQLRQKEAFYNKKEELAGGIPSIDDLPSRPNYWDDASQILNKGLKDVSSSFNLRKNFLEFLNISLEILGDEKKAFLLLIDDVDITFPKTWPILETIRKYLCTDKIIVIVSGDFELFSAAVRKIQWENFGKGLLKNEYDIEKDSDFYNDKIRYRRYVSSLEDQYLQKIFKVQNRIKLRTIRNILDSQESINLSFVDGKEISYRTLLDLLFRKLGMYNKYQAHTYEEFLQSASLRTQISLIKSIDLTENYTIEFDSDRNIIEPFISELISNDVDYENVIYNDYFLDIEILKFLVNNNCLAECYQLSPINDSRTINTCLFALSSYLALRFTKNPYIIFDYSIRIAYIYNVSSSFLNANENKDEQLKKLIKHSKLYNDISLRNITGYINSFVWSDKQLINGSFSVGKKFIKKISEASMDSTTKQILLLPYFRAYSTTNAQGNYIYSIFTLLASISEITRFIKETSPLDADFDGAILNILSELSEPKSFPMFESARDTFTNKKNQDTNEDEEDSSEDDKIINEDINIDIIYSIKEWINYVNQLEITVPPYVIGKIITRAYNSFDNFSRKKKYGTKNKSKQINDFVNMSVLNLLNSALIEEFSEFASVYSQDIKNENLGFYKTNLVTSTDNFKVNLEKFKKILDNNKYSTIDLPNIKMNNNFFSVSKLLLTCPLLLVFINPDYFNNTSEKSLDILKEISLKLLKDKKLNKEGYFDEIFKTDVYKKLGEVCLNQTTSNGK